MAARDTQRRLSAILSADVAGYSRLMGADEEATIETLTAYRQVFLSHIAGHRGRIVDAKGDAILAEFGSVVDAVASAMAIQRALADRNAGLPAGRRMDFRIGINLGDVVVQDDVIYGDGVNIAARLEALAEPGGICISSNVHDQVESRLGVDCAYLGEQRLKNIAKPVSAYRIELPQAEGEPARPAPVRLGAGGSPLGDAPLTPPERPSLAVLPFSNMSGDPDQEYFSDGITEDLITDLARIPRLFVIARTSVFVYKGRPVDVRRVGRELGVRYVLEGSVRREAQRVRITAQLVDTFSGEHLWAQRYDRELKEIFALQDEVTRDIAGELEVKLVEGEQARKWRRGTTNLEAYDLAMRGLDQVRQLNPADHARGRRFLEAALEKDPKFACAMVWLAWTYLFEAIFSPGENAGQQVERAAALADRALAVEKTFGTANELLCIALLYKGDYDAAIGHGERAVALNPDDADANAFLSVAFSIVGRGEEALAKIKTALRVNPYPPPFYAYILATAYRVLGRFEEAITAYQQCLAGLPDYLNAVLGLTMAYVEVGRLEEAREQARRALQLCPDFSSSGHPSVRVYKDPAVRERVTALYREAGLPD